MRRRDKEGGKAAKTQRRKTLAHRNTPKAARHRSSAAAVKETNIEQLTHELAEAREREAATAEVLKVISSTPGELEPVFNAMLANATRICGATIGTLYLYEEASFRGVAIHHSKQSYVDFWQRNRVVELKKTREFPSIASPIPSKLFTSPISGPIRPTSENTTASLRLSKPQACGHLYLCQCSRTAS